LERICSWLTNANFGTVYSESLSKATEGTGMWFIESREFIRWKRGDFNILWGTGKREFKMLNRTVLRKVDDICIQLVREKLYSRLYFPLFRSSVHFCSDPPTSQVYRH
jgi:hypothetical protein